MPASSHPDTTTPRTLPFWRNPPACPRHRLSFTAPLAAHILNTARPARTQAPGQARRQPTTAGSPPVRATGISSCPSARSSASVGTWLPSARTQMLETMMPCCRPGRLTREKQHPPFSEKDFNYPERTVVLPPEPGRPWRQGGNPVVSAWAAPSAWEVTSARRTAGTRAHRRTGSRRRAQRPCRRATAGPRG